MIDTIKIYTQINKAIFDKIKSLSIIKSSYNCFDGEIYYEIINDHLIGSYDSRLSIRVGCGSKYHFAEDGYYLEIEGSYHKIVRGYNSHNGYYDLNFVCKSLIELAENSYNVNLPNIDKWFLQRCDIAICFNLNNQENVKSYINSLSRCQYPRRNVKFYYDESMYLSGSTTTLKIYNKMLEFKKHDLKNFASNLDNSFDIYKYLDTIKGFIRFECEIKKKKLCSLFNNDKHIKVIEVNYNLLRNVWSEEFMKLLKIIKNDLEIVRSREDVYNRLNSLYKKCTANRLYNFYCCVKLIGFVDAKEKFSKSTFNRCIKQLKEAKIDFSQSYKIEEKEMFSFDPFEYKEVV